MFKPSLLNKNKQACYFLAQMFINAKINVDYTIQTLQSMLKLISVINFIGFVWLGFMAHQPL